MHKICYRNPSKSEVIGRSGRDEKTEWPRRTDKSQTLKNKQKTTHTPSWQLYYLYHSVSSF